MNSLNGICLGYEKQPPVIGGFWYVYNKHTLSWYNLVVITWHKLQTGVSQPIGILES